MEAFRAVISLVLPCMSCPGDWQKKEASWDRLDSGKMKTVDKQQPGSLRKPSNSSYASAYCQAAADPPWWSEDFLLTGEMNGLLLTADDSL